MDSGSNMKVYCDTCIYIDAMGLSNSSDPLRPLADFAWVFFDAVKKGRYVLVTSSWLFEEFRKVVGDELISFIEELKLENKIHIQESREDRKEARMLGPGNFPDARHVVLAKKAGALIITTRNLKDFAEFEDYLKKHSIELSLPESL